ncbi:hypothetical protein E2C01_055268 [Portunus trituberculatus]|uniref:Uncharacterized protein n=1 Tax=Portunus trituberculatus TaxID=210409 RepID=A0A5B7GQQ7_PORTR|nr:hypothetical protein [Portunus trituberculatus]
MLSCIPGSRDGKSVRAKIAAELDPLSGLVSCKTDVLAIHKGGCKTVVHRDGLNTSFLRRGFAHKHGEEQYIRQPRESSPKLIYPPSPITPRLCVPGAHPHLAPHTVASSGRFSNIT